MNHTFEDLELYIDYEYLDDGWNTIEDIEEI
jgi:hypothetical protein